MTGSRMRNGLHRSLAQRAVAYIVMQGRTQSKFSVGQIAIPGAGHQSWGTVSFFSDSHWVTPTPHKPRAQGQFPWHWFTHNSQSLFFASRAPILLSVLAEQDDTHLPLIHIVAQPSLQHPPPEPTNKTPPRLGPCITMRALDQGFPIRINLEAHQCKSWINERAQMTLMKPFVYLGRA